MCDDAIFGIHWLGELNKKQQVPIAALLFKFAITFIIGRIYLDSTSMFNAFIDTGLTLQHVTCVFLGVLLVMSKQSVM